MKLFIVRYSGEVLLGAEDITDARRKADFCVREEFRYGSGSPDKTEVDAITHVDWIPEKWRGALVWGCDEDTTAESLLTTTPAKEG